VAALVQGSIQQTVAGCALLHREQAKARIPNLCLSAGRDNFGAWKAGDGVARRTTKHDGPSYGTVLEQVCGEGALWNTAMQPNPCVTRLLRYGY